MSKNNSGVLGFECDTWRNERTGETVMANTFVKKCGRKGFVIAYMEAIVNLLDIIGGKKMQVLRYILDNMDLGSNTLIITVQKLSIAAKVSKITVIRTLKLLEENAIISRQTNAIMLNPKLLHRGNGNKEVALMTRFDSFQK